MKKKKRDDLAMVISKILRMPTGEIDSEITVEYGDNLIIHGIKNLNAAIIMNLGNGVIKNEWIESPEDYIKTSIVVNRDLIASKKQIIFTTHSPMMLNYLEDDIALQSVIYIKNNDDTGITSACRFFETSEVKTKLEYMGPGEIYANIDLKELL